MNLRSKLEEKKISDDCFLNTYITYDEQNYVLEINYLDGKFIAEKIFTNDFNGVANMEEVRNNYESERDVKKYFGII